MYRILIILLVIVCSVQVQAQKKKFKPKRIVLLHVNEKEQSLTFQVLNKEKNVLTRNKSLYYWYKSNQVFNSQGGVGGKLLHRTYTAYYLSGDLKEKGKFKRGLKSARWKSWHENGKLKELSRWKKGVRKGYTYTFNKEGELQSKTFYKKDMEINKKQRRKERWERVKMIFKKNENETEYIGVRVEEDSTKAVTDLATDKANESSVHKPIEKESQELEEMSEESSSAEASEYKESLWLKLKAKINIWKKNRTKKKDSVRRSKAKEEEPEQRSTDNEQRSGEE